MRPCWSPRPSVWSPCRTSRIRSRRICASASTRRRTRAAAVPAPVAAVAAEAGAVAAVASRAHRVGLGWRPELAAGIFANLDRIDLVEVLADQYFHASSRERDA